MRDGLSPLWHRPMNVLITIISHLFRLITCFSFHTEIIHVTVRLFLLGYFLFFPTHTTPECSALFLTPSLVTGLNTVAYPIVFRIFSFTFPSLIIQQIRSLRFSVILILVCQAGSFFANSSSLVLSLSAFFVTFSSSLLPLALSLSFYSFFLLPLLLFFLFPFRCFMLCYCYFPVYTRKLKATKRERDKPGQSTSRKWFYFPLS